MEKPAYAAATNGYSFLGDASGRGGIQASLLGPGQTASQQLFYLTYTYINGTLDLVTIDPNGGQYRVYAAPVRSEQAAWAMTNGPDANIYIGTLPHAHLLRFTPQMQTLFDLGQVPVDPHTRQAQSYIWQLTTSAYNRTVYGCTYPSADLISYDPLTARPQIVNLGSMDATGKEQYVRMCAADPQANAPYIYLGLGSISNQLAIYNIATHTIIKRISGNTAGFGSVYRGTDGKIYGSILNGGTKEYYLLSNGQAIATTTPASSAPPNVLKDGGTINVGSNTVSVNYPNNNPATRSYPYLYAGKKLSIYRIGSGPDGKIYGGTVLPYDFLSYDPSQKGVHVYGQVGDGQPYVLQAYQGQLYIGTYAAAPLAVYRPTVPFGQANPAAIPATTLPTDLRPHAIAGTTENTLYVGATASYGKLTGPLLVWHTQGANAIQAYYPVTNQSIHALATTTRACQGSNNGYCLIGGTTIYGGTGIQPTATAAQLFTWDTSGQQILHTYSLPAASANPTVTALFNNPDNGYVYGITTGHRGNYLFIFDPISGRFILPGSLLPLKSGVIYNSLTIYQGNLWGASSDGFFSMSLRNVKQFTLRRSPARLTAGFARQVNVLYAASDSGLWSYTIV
ncbi:MAG TPA: hypothetical protein VL485_00980 [Ktedonobacteraceae bacterium]|nr:hypothetical protein [Ktedonobacteraceae bacterium]